MVTNEPATAWTMYWQASNLDSCIANTHQSDHDVFSVVWSDFAQSLDEHASILDLATGNGTVPLKLFDANAHFKITGVDLADISPADYLSTHARLKKVDFIGNTDICHLPFNNNQFDGITSQFGFEYANKIKASKELFRVLKPQGRFQLIIHFDNSEIVKPAEDIINELTLILTQNGLVDTLKDFVVGDIEASKLEHFYQQFLVANKGKLTKRITGKIFAFVEGLLMQHEKGHALSNTQTMNMIRRLTAEHERLSQLSAAALSRNEVDNFIKELQLYCSEVHLKPMLIDNPVNEAIIAWSISGTKT